ncbi:hypothetical protein B4U79_11302 [Dinothrombium tinctorium]|uniref:Uncharacterized protein n=1 Tax=Dinothrombium tinctorium TaxID=1965070 RepID=A0A3S3Q0J9_9ACAR|nr:hypothetical protein B4U79_13594 [Dinothrombium tinctorium]RWS11650.1 hypothetical protein B4U79_11302 [Dinothrombium tinctorium]
MLQIQLQAQAELYKDVRIAIQAYANQFNRRLPETLYQQSIKKQIVSPRIIVRDRVAAVTVSPIRPTTDDPKVKTSTIDLRELLKKELDERAREQIANVITSPPSSHVNLFSRLPKPEPPRYNVTYDGNLKATNGHSRVPQNGIIIVPSSDKTNDSPNLPQILPIDNLPKNNSQKVTTTLTSSSTPLSIIENYPSIPSPNDESNNLAQSNSHPKEKIGGENFENDYAIDGRDQLIDTRRSGEHRDTAGKGTLFESDRSSNKAVRNKTVTNSNSSVASNEMTKKKKKNEKQEDKVDERLPKNTIESPDSNRLTTERLAYLLIGSCCALSVFCLIVVAFSIRCRDMCDEYKAWKKAEKFAMMSNYRYHQNSPNKFHWRRPSQFHADTFYRMPQQVAVNQLNPQFSRFARPIFGPACCCCPSAPWVAVKNESCPRGYCHPCPRGKLPFGAASSIQAMPRSVVNNNIVSSDEDDSLNVSVFLDENNVNRAPNGNGQKAAPRQPSNVCTCVEESSLINNNNNNKSIQEHCEQQRRMRMAKSGRRDNPVTKGQSWLQSSIIVDELHKKHCDYLRHEIEFSFEFESFTIRVPQAQQQKLEAEKVFEDCSDVARAEVSSRAPFAPFNRRMLIADKTFSQR